MGLTPEVLRKLAAVCRMFASPFEGERANAAMLADKLVKDHGTDWGDISHAEPPVPVIVQPKTPRCWRQCAEEVLYEHPGACTSWEQGFLQDILRRGYGLSPKQELVLRRIAAKCGAPEW
jgi:hypothetical protein